MVAYIFSMIDFFERTVLVGDRLVTGEIAAPGRLEQAGSIESIPGDGGKCKEYGDLALTQDEATGGTGKGRRF